MLALCNYSLQYLRCSRIAILLYMTDLQSTEAVAAETTNLSEEHSPWSYLAAIPPADLVKLDEQLTELRKMSAPLENLSLPISEMARLGTGAVLTNRVTAEFLDTFGPDDIYRAQRQRAFANDAQRRYWGDTDVRGCYFVVLESGDTFSAIHLPFNAAEDLDNFGLQLRRLVTPIKSTGVTSARLHIAGGFEEPASRDTLASLTHGLASSLSDVEISTLDVLGRDQGARKPVFDTETRKMYEALPI